MRAIVVLVGLIPLLGVLILAPPPSAAQEAQRAKFHIDAQPLGGALVAFAEQAGLSLSYSGLDLDPYTAPALHGTYALGDAIAELLAGAPFVFSFVNANAVRISAEGSEADRRKTRYEPAPSLEEIIVTATKRREDARILPLGVSTWSGLELDSRGTRDFQQMAAHLAGVAVTELGQGRNKIFIRGISDGVFSDRTQSTVGVYFDETPVIFSNTNPDLRLIDVERVEIVRGPQGTLFGAGTIGGLYRIIPRRPDPTSGPDSYARVITSLTETAGVNAGAEGAVNVPLVDDRLALRLAGFYQADQGYIDDARLGLEDTNDAEQFGGRVSARWLPGDSWTVDLGYAAEVTDLDDRQYTVPALGALKRANFLREPYEDTFHLVNLTLRREFAGFDLVSASSGIFRTIDDQSDATLAIPVILEDILDDPAGPGPYRTHDRLRAFSHETRLVSRNGGPFEWLVGVFYQRHHEKTRFDLQMPHPMDMTRTVSLFAGTRNEMIEEVAGFGEAVFEFLDRWKLTVGLRGARTSFRVRSSSVSFMDAVAPTNAGETSQTNLSPKTVLSYRFLDDSVLFFQAAHGYRVGGVNINTPESAIEELEADEEDEPDFTEFEADKLWSFEVGVKANLWEGRLALNASAFHIKWDGIQTDQPADTGLLFVANAGDAKVNGAELEASVQVTPDFEASAAVTWLDSEISEANPFLNARAGDQLPGVSDVSVGVSATYMFDLTPDWRASVSADYSFVGEGTLIFGDGTVPRTGGYQSGNFRLQTVRDEWRAGIFVNNIFNERGKALDFGNTFSLPHQKQLTPLRPRTVGFFLERSF